MPSKNQQKLLAAVWKYDDNELEELLKKTNIEEIQGVNAVVEGANANLLAIAFYKKNNNAILRLLIVCAKEVQYLQNSAQATFIPDTVKSALLGYSTDPIAKKTELWRTVQLYTIEKTLELEVKKLESARYILESKEIHLMQKINLFFPEFHQLIIGNSINDKSSFVANMCTNLIAQNIELLVSTKGAVETIYTTLQRKNIDDHLLEELYLELHKTRCFIDNLYKKLHLINIPTLGLKAKIQYKFQQEMQNLFRNNISFFENLMQLFDNCWPLEFSEYLHFLTVNNNRDEGDSIKACTKEFLDCLDLSQKAIFDKNVTVSDYVRTSFSKFLDDFNHEKASHNMREYFYYIYKYKQRILKLMDEMLTEKQLTFITPSPEGVAPDATATAGATVGSKLELAPTESLSLVTTSTRAEAAANASSAQPESTEQRAVTSTDIEQASAASERQQRKARARTAAASYELGTLTPAEYAELQRLRLEKYSEEISKFRRDKISREAEKRKLMYNQILATIGKTVSASETLDFQEQFEIFLKSKGAVAPSSIAAEVEDFLATPNDSVLDRQLQTVLPKIGFQHRLTDAGMHWVYPGSRFSNTYHINHDHAAGSFYVHHRAVKHFKDGIITSKVVDSLKQAALMQSSFRC